MKVTMIDNFDSFTYNLVQYLQQLGLEVCTYRNNARTPDEIVADNPDFIVLSPGPSVPDQAGHCLQLVKEAATRKIPLLGVCLGHQVIAQSFGGKISPYSPPHHGKVSAIHHKDTGVFKGLPNPVRATRYHSLVIEQESLPACFEVTATSEDQYIQGIRHKTLPIEGVQFHPESILTECGHQMLANFAQSF